MKNVTLSVDDKVLAAVRRYRAERESSVKALVREFLISIAKRHDHARTARARIRSHRRRALALIENDNTVQGFAQDDVQLGPKLTVNLGLRYESLGPWSEKTHRMSNFDLRTGMLVVPNAASIQLLNPNLVARYGSLIRTAEQTGLPESMVDFSRWNFAPRIGFAWRAMRDTVVRAG